ncbi:MULTISPECIES: ABC transporter ATP-binding protein [unclassified Treponema]|uniref:ABC transporter ATP-binding protein n=1 Tax=unclassified Treponema TaxID=2638727 RepID=UPI0020A53DF7|nr:MULTISPECIES: ABC transporter ATP-binding protein [unclassified Treponema]UTC67073.1 ABC transporter ATP-binding protein [Treponema sp. OMZ 789]UTC69804.1 ABC transporter ATP-binding protein [Treponema sp. OMZ 790]UTC72518.1 ABC transporter ATP-binding protein [Treponema sp. OMZ 791]
MNLKERGLLKNSLYMTKNILKTDKILFFLMLLYIPVFVLSPFASAYLPRTVIESIQNKAGIFVFIQNFLIIALIVAILKALETFLTARLNCRGAYQRMDFMISLYQKIWTTSYKNISSQKGMLDSGKAQEMCMGDDTISQQFPKKISSLIVSIVGIFFFGSLVASINPVLLGLIFVSGAVSYFYGKYEVKKSKEINEVLKKEHHKMKYLTQKACNYKFAKDIKLYKIEKWIVQAYKVSLKIISKCYRKIKTVNFIGSIISALFIFLRDGLAYLYLTGMVLNKEIGIGEFIFLFSIIKTFSLWLLGIISQITHLKRECLTIDYYRNFCELDDGLNRGKGLPLPKKFDIELKNVSFKYDNSSRYIFKDFNLRIEDKEKLAIVGINGAGKTTLTCLIMNLLQPTEGEVLLNGKNINEYNIDEYYSLFSTVFQDIFILPDTIKNMITAGNKAFNQDDFASALKQSGLQKIIDTLNEKENTYLVKGVWPNAVDLSGGQEQRLMLARALYKNGSISILDEPTAALDPIAESQIYSEYNNMTKNKTSIFISHRLASTRFCDRIILIENGKIIEGGSHSELMKQNGEYKKMFELQSSYYQD